MVAFIAEDEKMMTVAACRLCWRLPQRSLSRLANQPVPPCPSSMWLLLFVIVVAAGSGYIHPAPLARCKTWPIALAAAHLGRAAPDAPMRGTVANRVVGRSRIAFEVLAVAASLSDALSKVLAITYGLTLLLVTVVIVQSVWRTAFRAAVCLPHRFMA